MGPTSDLVRARDVRLAYPNATVALAGVAFTLARHEFVSVVGPSGCGKSTLLRLVAGLLAPTAGEIRVDDRAPAAARRDRQEISFVFQFPALLPWRTVAANARLPLELRGQGRAAADRQVGPLLELVGLDAFAGAWPHELSGGMQMRVSLARALANRPSLLLLDEPFGALDEITRQRLNEDLLRLWARDRWAGLFVTHNVFEAVFLSQRVLVMSARPGRFVADIPVPWPYPRAPELRARPEFARLAGTISQQLLETAA